MTGVLTTNDPRTISEEVALIAADEARSTEFLRRVESERREKAQRARIARGASDGGEWMI